MFLNHFSLNDHPFTENPPIQWLLRDPRIDQALAGLLFFEQQGVIGLILGQTGIGKSSLLRIFIHELPQNRYHPLYLHLTTSQWQRLSSGSIVTRLGKNPKTRAKESDAPAAPRSHQPDEKTTLLIIDEAHLIDPQTLTDLRVLISSIGDQIPLKNPTVRPGEPTSHPQTFLPDRPAQPHNPPAFCSNHTQRIKPALISTTASLRPGAQTRSLNQRPKNSSMTTPQACLDKSIMSLPPVCSMQPLKTSKKITDALVNDTMAQYQLP